MKRNMDSSALENQYYHP